MPKSLVLGMVAAVLLLPTACDSPTPAAREKPLPPPPQVVPLSLQDYRFDYEPPVSQGRVVFRVHNAGSQAHEVVLVPLPDDFPPIDKQLRSEKRQGAATIVDLPTQPPGATTTFAVDLAPGRYAMVCFREGADKEIHALKGMTSEFRVK